MLGTVLSYLKWTDWEVAESTRPELDRLLNSCDFFRFSNSLSFIRISLEVSKAYDSWLNERNWRHFVPYGVVEIAVELERDGWLEVLGSLEITPENAEDEEVQECTFNYINRNKSLEIVLWHILIRLMI